MTTEYKTYDSSDNYSIKYARMAKDAEIRPGNRGDMVKLTFVSTCRGDRHSDLWIEATVSDFNSELAKHIRKGDVVCISGKPALRRFGDDLEKFSFELLRADVTIAPDMFKVLKERGFVPGAKADGAAPNKKAAAKKVATKPTKKTIVEIPDDDDSDDDSGEE